MGFQVWSQSGFQLNESARGLYMPVRDRLNLSQTESPPHQRQIE